MTDLNKLFAQVRQIRENASILQLLERQVCSPLGVIPLVGAGLSCALGLPSWTEFLMEQGRLAGIANEIRSHIRSGEYEEAAETLLKRRLSRRFEDAVRYAFGKKPNSDDTSTAVFQLPFMCSGPVVTTNFDPVLEYVFDRVGKPFDKIVLGGRVDDAIEALHLNERLLVKLHGDYAFPQDRVLTLGEYTKAYGSPEPQAVDMSLPLPKFLRFIMQNRPFLFLGCSLNQDRTIRVLRQVIADYPSLAHYALLAIPANKADVMSRDRFLSDLGIRPIWYPQGQHQAIKAVLLYLSGGIATNSRLTQWLPSVRKRIVLPNKQTEELRSELKLAGYPCEPLKTLLLVGTNQNRTSHSTIFLETTILGTPKVIKLTKKHLCRLPVLRQLIGLTADIREGATIVRFGVPEWVGESTKYVIEVMPLFSGVTLNEMILRSRSRVAGDLLANIFNCLVRLADVLHKMEILHRDINPTNILIGTDGDDVALTLLDMSFACVTSDKNQIPVVSQGYTAPEQLKGHAVKSSDFYGVAATSYFLANRNPPNFGAKAEFDRGLRAIDIGEYHSGFSCSEPDTWTSDDFFISKGDFIYRGSVELFGALLDPDVSRRPSNPWEIILTTHSRPAIIKEETGRLDLGRFGSIVLMKEDYAVRPLVESSSRQTGDGWNC